MSGDSFYASALRRIRLLTLLLGIAGTVALFTFQSWRTATGFLLGAALSVLNFQGVAILAGSLGGSKKPGIFAASLVALRYAVIGFALYVILRLLGFAPVPVLAGLLAPFGATILEILYELVFLHER